jgi:hypothetical protein
VCGAFGAPIRCVDDAARVLSQAVTAEMVFSDCAALIYVIDAQGDAYQVGLPPQLGSP